MPFGVPGELVFAGSGLLVLTMLVLDLTGVLNRGRGFRWQATGLLIENTAVGASGFVRDHGWTGDWTSVLEAATVPVLVAGFAVLVVGVTIWDRERRKARQAG